MLTELDPAGKLDMIQNRSLVPSLLPATIESAHEPLCPERTTTEPIMITPQQIALGERLRVNVMYSSMKRPALPVTCWIA